MLRNRFRWTGPIMGMLFGLGLLALGDNAAAQYVGADACAECHATEYSSWSGHGHAWMQNHLGGQPPSEELIAAYAAFGVGIPELPEGYEWSEVEDLFGNFRDGEGYFLLTNGNRLSHGSEGSMPARCNKCHNPSGFIDPPVPDEAPHEAHADAHAYFAETFGESRIQGSWALSGIQCEQCHGQGFSMAIPDKQICRDCHSSGDEFFRIPEFTADPTLFGNHHGEGDEYRRSPHKDLGCAACHNPHKSVWKKQGGVLYADDPTSHESVGMMCTHCHTKTRIRGTMGEIGLVCVDCHMPENSAQGHRSAHIFRINSEPLRAADNYLLEGSRNYWKNFDGTTGEGDSFITLDMACGACHDNRTVEELAVSAKYIHRQPGLVDLEINGGDSLQIVRKGATVSVNFAIYPEELGEEAAVTANTYVLVRTPRGWYYWNGRRWRKGIRRWIKQAPIEEVSENVLNSPLKKGMYTFWVYIAATNGDEYADSVPVYVRKR